MRDIRYSYSLQLHNLNISKSQLEVRDKWAKEFSLVNWNNAIYFVQAGFFGGNVTQINIYLQVESIQSKEQKQTLNAMCLGSFTSLDI